jgi:predicted transcriptional regulator
VDINEVIKFHDLGLTPKEIENKINVPQHVIRLRLKELDIKPNTKRFEISSSSLLKIKNLVKEGKTNKEIADILGISSPTVRKYVNKLGLESNSKRTKTLTNKVIELTQEQKEVLYGSLLGDMCIDTNWKISRPAISQGGNQEEYFDYKCKIFNNLIGKPSKKDRYDKRTKKWYHKYTVRFLTNPIYNELKDKLYINGVKTVTKEWLNMLTPRSIAFWFMDDGSNSGVIATNSFSKEECLLIIDWFREKYNIECTLQNDYNNGHHQYMVYVTAKSKPIFYNLVIDYFIPSMLYKLKNWNPQKSHELRETS